MCRLALSLRPDFHQALLAETPVYAALPITQLPYLVCMLSSNSQGAAIGAVPLSHSLLITWVVQALLGCLSKQGLQLYAFGDTAQTLISVPSFYCNGDAWHNMYQLPFLVLFTYRTYTSLFSFSAPSSTLLLSIGPIPSTSGRPHEDIYCPLSCVPSCEERAGPGTVDDETGTDGAELPLQSEL